MSALTNYIVKAAVCTVSAVVVVEGLMVVRDTIKMKKVTVKQLRTNGYAEKDIKEQSKDIWLESIKEAARLRVEMIKTEPFGEIMGICGCVTYFLGNWKGYFKGFGDGWNYGSEDVNRLMAHFRDKYPVELTKLVKRAINDKDSIELSRWFEGDTFHSASWVAEKCNLPKIKEVEA